MLLHGAAVNVDIFVEVTDSTKAGGQAGRKVRKNKRASTLTKANETDIGDS